MDDGWAFEDDFLDEIDNEETEEDEIEDELGELLDDDAKFDGEEEHSDDILDDSIRFTEKESAEDEFFIQNILNVDDVEIAFMLGFGDIMTDNSPPRKADRHRKEEGDPIPLVNQNKKIPRGLADEFLAEFNMKNSR